MLTKQCDICWTISFAPAVLCLGQISTSASKIAKWQRKHLENICPPHWGKISIRVILYSPAFSSGVCVHFFFIIAQNIGVRAAL
jgi:hypothetical protein